MTAHGPDGTRRRLLAGLAIGVYAAPTLLTLTGARASSASFSSRPARRQPRPRARRAARPRPELVVAALDAAVIDAIAADGFTLLSRDTIALTGAALARFQAPANLTIEQARARVRELSPAATEDLNSLYRPSSLDCGEAGCAAFEMVGWAPETSACAAGVTIGMVDTAVNPDHAALAGVDVELIDMRTEGRRSSSAVHGTGIAVLLAGRSDTRTPGLLENVKLVAADGFHRDTSGQDVADAFDIARSLDRLATMGVRVINLSLSGPDNAVLREVVTALVARDTILVAAAGNEGPNADPLYPAAYDGVVAVTAVDREGKVYRQANAGEHIDFAAPGVRLWTAASVSGGRFRSGTSYAAPFVTAVLAAAHAATPDRPGADLVADLAARAVDLGSDGRDATYGWGLVQGSEACGSVSPIPAAAGGVR